MRTILCALVLITGLVAPAVAQEKSSTFAVGYSPAIYLGTSLGMSPFGVSLSASTTHRRTGFEVDFAFHREEGLNTVTAAVGPRWGHRGAAASSFVHALFLFRNDFASDVSNSFPGVMLGFGADLGRARRGRLRLAGDLQIVFDSGGILRVVRLTAGVAL
jgi:hypothetical protein